ncbi:hypothetical protein G3T14_19520 [Methylobacterium sp. BTF04]|uniref:hypothetical protein n=1 Tax=Methylobacterium sp. BTF04 TaxID=2708300 RepID=UPI0013D2324E|nr:hypothetical protein [Methylobacterium sp. BTF04]NEU14300.1 hypothetical protein [Methylobacterium sp. BTF04]
MNEPHRYQRTEAEIAVKRAIHRRVLRRMLTIWLLLCLTALVVTAMLTWLRF